jgi:hypothetical protein
LSFEKNKQFFQNLKKEVKNLEKKCHNITYELQVFTFSPKKPEKNKKVKKFF